MPYVEGDVDDAGQLVQRDHVRPVGRRAVRIGMRFEEEAVGPRGGRGVEQRRDEVAQAAARALGLDRPRHALGRHPLPLFHVHGASGATGRYEQVGLTAQEGRDLQHVGDLRGGGYVAGLVDIGENRQARRGPHFGERREPALGARPPWPFESRAVRLVVGGLVDDVQPDLCREIGERLADPQVQVVGLDDAGSRDQEGGAPPSEVLRHVSRGGRRVETTAPPGRGAPCLWRAAAGAQRPRTRRTGGAAGWVEISARGGTGSR